MNHSTHPVSAPRVRRRLLLTLALGETPEQLPTESQRRRGIAAAVRKIHGGAIDRVLRHFGSDMQVTRLHDARSSAQRYDDSEQLTGIARVLRVEVEDDSRMHPLVDALRQLPTVERVTPDYVAAAPFLDATAVMAANSDVAAAWETRRLIRLPEALGYEPGSPSVVLGLADTGIVSRHAEIAQQVRAGFDTVDLRVSEVTGYTLVGDYSARDEDPMDEVGHGTGCAGILVANGEVLPPGAAGACGVVPVRVLGAALGPNQKRVGIGAIANIDQGMKRLIDLGAKVINMSFGTPASALLPDDPSPHEEIVNYALSRGCILIAASGNSGQTERFFPAAHPDVIAVGAVDARGVLASFSTRGDHVSICAPGHGIWTCGLAGYTQASGTSFASPFVAGVVALLVARAERRAYPLDAQRTREVLMASARPFATVEHEGGGAGIIDAFAALQRLDKTIDEWLGGEP